MTDAGPFLVFLDKMAFEKPTWTKKSEGREAFCFSFSLVGGIDLLSWDSTYPRGGDSGTASSPPE